LAPDAGGDLSTEPTAEEPLGTRVGGRIRQRRRELGRKLAEVAADAGLSVGYLSSIEKGGKVPSLPVLARLSHRSTVHTDGWQAYWTVGEHGYTHERTVMRQQAIPPTL
jgi:transcriptional regulator with XRE-family HTH domain